MTYQFKARPKKRAGAKTNATGTKLPTLPALKGKANAAAPTKSKKKPAKKSGKAKVSGSRTIDYQDLAPGVRVTQTPGM